MFNFVLMINQYTDNISASISARSAYVIMNHMYVSAAAEVLDSCKKVENQLVSFAAVGVVMDEEAVQEATSTCQAADKLIQVSRGVVTNPHRWTPPQLACGYLGLSACLHLLHYAKIADQVPLRPASSCNSLLVYPVPAYV